MTWCGMRARCYNPRNKKFPIYGGRGITVCNRWLNSFEDFYEDMGDPPTDKHSIEREDNNKGYSPENCVWATYKQQNNNRSNTVFITYKGVVDTLSGWADRLGMSRDTIKLRLRRGWSIEKTLTTPYITKEVGILYRGETLSMRGWAKRFGMAYNTLYYRIAQGWPMEEALTTPVKRSRK